jgi:hypothetical protein
MDTLSLYRRRDRYWREVQRYFGGLSSRLFQQALILSHNLALNYSDDAQLQNILRRRQDYPLLDLHFRLLDDWAVPENNGREAFEKNLMLAMTFAFMGVETKIGIADPYSHLDDGFIPLQNELAQRAEFHFRQIFSDSSPFWEHHQRAWSQASTPASPLDPLPVTGPWAFASLSAIAAAIWAGRDTQLPQLLEMTEHLRFVFQIVSQLSSLRRDLRDGRLTHPIQRARQAAGMGEETNLGADYVAGMLILSGALEKICRENHARIESARVVAVEQNLQSFQVFCDNADALMHQIRKKFSLKNQAPAEDEALRAFFVPAFDVLPNVLQKAESHLLAEPTFYEAWEVQRHTFKEYPLLHGRAFPSALILEILSLHGCDVSAQIDAVFETYKSSDFRYYDVPETLAPDIDDVAFALRLCRHSSQPEKHKILLQTPLRWVRENQMPSGQIPVWLRRNDSQHQISPLAMLYGENCATVEANLLLGLIDFDWENYRDVIEACAASWCERWLAAGLGATGHYTPLFSLWTGLELISKLSKQTRVEKLHEDLKRTAAKICGRIECEAESPNVTPQSASFLTLACLRLKEFSLPFHPDWIAVLFKNQRCDGSWEGEPLYVVPSGRGLGTMWYASRTVTAAFCYHALKHYQSYRMDE